MREEHSIDTMSAFAAPAARGIELCRVRVMIRMQAHHQHAIAKALQKIFAQFALGLLIS